MITAEAFVSLCGCRSVGECEHDYSAETDALKALVDAFAVEMKKKLLCKAREGWGGWDNPENKEHIKASLLHHVKLVGQEVDVANLAAMLWNMSDEHHAECGQLNRLLEDSERECCDYALKLHTITKERDNTHADRQALACQLTQAIRDRDELRETVKVLSERLADMAVERDELVYGLSAQLDVQRGRVLAFKEDCIELNERLAEITADRDRLKPGLVSGRIP